MAKIVDGRAQVTCRYLTVGVFDECMLVEHHAYKNVMFLTLILVVRLPCPLLRYDP